MKYIDAITRYYNCFSSSGYTKIKGKNKSRVHISGKLNFKRVFLWICISIFMLLISQSNDVERNFLHFKMRFFGDNI